MGGFLNRIFQFSIFNFISHPFISQSSSSLVIGHWTSVISNFVKTLLVSLITDVQCPMTNELKD